MVLKKINDVVYRVRNPPNGKPSDFHFNRLAPVVGMNEMTTTSNFKIVAESYNNVISHKQLSVRRN